MLEYILLILSQLNRMIELITPEKVMALISLIAVSGLVLVLVLLLCAPHIGDLWPM